ncbi:hypothetical protein ACAG26_17005 [Mycobacterium sp. pUA109]|uniref:hypothetical protein n=1 Tax=Mycobacterium sp. pUA109 TaxID=3238982 RepID=UPI00351AB55B
MSEPQWPGQPEPGQPSAPPPGEYGPPPGQPPGPPPGPPGPPPGQPYGPPPVQCGPPPPGPYGPPAGPYGPPPGPYGPPPGPYGPWGYPPPAPPKRRKTWWVVGGLVVVVIAAVVAAVLVFAGGSTSKPPQASAQDLLLTQSDFPTLDPPGKFTTTSGKEDKGDDKTVTVSPSECNDMLGKDDATADTAKAELDNTDERGGGGDSRVGYTVRVTKAANPQYSSEFQSVLDKCGEVTFQGDVLTLKGTIKRLNVSGTKVPVNAAVASLQPDNAPVPVKVKLTMQVFLAVVRGTSVEVLSNRITLKSDGDTDTPDQGAVSLFNKQVEKIQNAT